jgi:hypothetical protein
MRGFPLPESEWFFTRGFEDGKWRIQIHYKNRCIADERAISESLAIKRAWDRLEEYCFNYGRNLVPDGARSRGQETRRKRA